MALVTLATPIALVGLGISNLAVRRLLEYQGVSADEILNFDDKGAGGAISNPEELMRAGVRTLVVSPGYPLAKDWIRDFAKQGVLVTSEIDFAASFLTSERVVAITGSLGKSTTTSLIGAGLAASGRPYFFGGNLGMPLADYVLASLKGERPRAEFVALELSSFQLECAKALPMSVGVLTYLCSNHLERYDSLEHYYDTKLVVFHRSELCFSNAASSELHDFLGTRGLLASKKLKEISVETGLLSRKQLDTKALVGEHNCENLQVAAAVLNELGVWNAATSQALLNFPGLAHRMERIAMPEGSPIFINDSKATALESVLTAVESVRADAAFRANPKARLVCFIGGRDKKHPWEKLSPLGASASGLDFVFFGESGTEALRRSGLRGEAYPTLRAAMESLKARVSAGDWVLLSPGGTSLDEFKNFEDRGCKFAEWAREIWI